MDSTTNSASGYTHDFLQHIVNGLPRFLGALVILLIGYIVAKALQTAVRSLLERAELNKHVHAGKGGNIIQRAIPDPTALVATVVYWVVFLFILSIAVSYLGIPALVEFIRGIYAYLPNVFAALLIFLVAGAVSAAIATLIVNTMGDTPTGKIVGSAAPVLVMTIATFMILNQLKIAPEIVNLTYGIVLGSIGLGMALAFGLGGRDVAGQMLQGIYEKSQAQKGQVTVDLKKGANNAKARANDLRDRL